MRRIVVWTVTVLLLVAARPVVANATSSTYDVGACVLGGGAHEFQATLNPSDLSIARDEARDLLGGQFVMLWLSARDQGWAVGITPGPLDKVTVRDSLVSRLRSRLGTDAAARLEARLRIYTQPYSERELRDTLDRLTARFVAADWGVGWTGGIPCFDADAFRVEMTMFSDASSEVIAQARAIVDQEGDRARLTISPSRPPEPQAGPIAAPPGLPSGPNTPPGGNPSVAPEQRRPVVRVGEFVAGPRSARCVRGNRIRLRVIAERRGAIATISVRARGRARTIAGRQLAGPIAVAVDRPATTVQVRLTLRDGRTAVREQRFVRCRTA